MAATEIDLTAILPDSLYPPKQAAKVVNKSEKTLANDRCAGRGPAFHRIGGTPFYRGRDLLQYIESSRVSVGTDPIGKPQRKRAAA